MHWQHPADPQFQFLPPSRRSRLSPGTHKCAVDDLPVAVDVIYMQTTLPVKKRSLSLPRLRCEYYCCIAAARVILTVTKNGFASRINHSTANKHARNAAQKNWSKQNVEQRSSRSPPSSTNIMSKRPCSSVPVQRPTVHWSASDPHALCQRGPTGSSEVAKCNRRPVVQHRWTTSLEHSACFCSRHKLVLVLRETPESVSFCLTATAPVALNWRP